MWLKAHLHFLEGAQKHNGEGEPQWPIQVQKLLPWALSICPRVPSAPGTGGHHTTGDSGDDSPDTSQTKGDHRPGLWDCHGLMCQAAKHNTAVCSLPISGIGERIRRNKVKAVDRGKDSLIRMKREGGMRERDWEGERIYAKQVMHNVITHHQLTYTQPGPSCSSLPFPSPSKLPLVLLFIMMLHDMEYLFDQFGSAVFAVSLPSFLLLAHLLCYAVPFLKIVRSTFNLQIWTLTPTGYSSW